jgi:hypothetical protein
MAEQHCWTEDDDLVAFYLSRHGTRFLGMGEATIAKALSERPLPDGGRPVDMPVSSLLKRIQNFNYLDGKPHGLSNFAPNKSGPIYEQYKNATIFELRPMVIQVLGLPIRAGVERSFKEFCDRFSSPQREHGERS